MAFSSMYIFIWTIFTWLILSPTTFLLFLNPIIITLVSPVPFLLLLSFSFSLYFFLSLNVFRVPGLLPISDKTLMGQRCAGSHNYWVFFSGIDSSCQKITTHHISPSSSSELFGALMQKCKNPSNMKILKLRVFSA